MLNRLNPKNDPFFLIFMVTAAGGILLRLSPLFLYPFDSPFHLGGLFYEFSRQIAANHFQFPGIIPNYSLDGIPFYYPPLAFYFQAILIYIFSPAPFLTVNLLPPVAAALSVPAFLWMTRQVFTDRRLQAAALLAYCFMPGAFVNQIEAAGLPESFGTLFLVIYFGWLFKAEGSGRLLSFFWTGLFLGLCILSSPGSAYAGFIILIIFFIKAVCRRARLKEKPELPGLLLAWATSLLISSPYWLNIALSHGARDFLAAFFAEQGLSNFINQVRYMVTFKPADSITFIGDEGAYGFLFDWVIFCGLIWALLNREYRQVLIFLILWLIPREGSWLVALPASLLAALGMVHVLLPLIQKSFSSPTNKPGTMPPLAPGIVSLVLILLMTGAAVLSIYSLVHQEEMTIDPVLISSLQENKSTLPDGVHVIVAGNTAFREWAPALLEREVLNCEFGLEWQPEEMKHVRLINEAIGENDLSAAVAHVYGYSGDVTTWLVGEPARVNRLLEGKQNSLKVSIYTQDQYLVIAKISARK